jgi:pilus assembly protein Flp/PilA
LNLTVRFKTSATVEALSRVAITFCFGVRENSMNILLVQFARDESGVTAIEYGLIAALISVVIITAAAAVGTSIAGVFAGISAQLSAAP